MEIKILEDKKELIRVKLVGESHSLGNLLREELFNDKKVVMAGYQKEHPLFDKSILVVKTKGEKAKDALKKAISRSEKRLKDLKKQVK
jgi:DNA-directed RNA polymerase subunit L